MTIMRYFYHDGENEIGPFTRDKLEQLRASGLVKTHTLIRDEFSNEWKEYKQIRPTEISDQIGEERGENTIHGDSHEDVIALSGVSSERSNNKSIWKNDVPTPWRRYAARLLDTSFNGGIAFVFLGIVLYAIAPAFADDFFALFETEGGVFLDLIATSFVASLIGGPLIGVTGFSLGKLIFGVKVTNIRGEKIGLVGGLKRDLSVFVNGLGLAIPLVSLITMYACYSKLTSNKDLSWDQGQHIVWYRPSGAGQYILNVVGIALIVLVNAIIQVLAST